ncbi:unnamed protein product [Acanthoscelides obtectus]|uniref:ADP-ribosylation factor-binding protein GGA1 n=2 Tax=Acanthoscelides obtectus TaxID=200917 RepID=A0A9P0KB56_ACAOB|nr:unnamed protein product [Acanthoscelides obtectus]CAK1623029.1 ADP-ribosylation factor-binding protein GGA2 [Acanthoscelides obtectus]
MDLVTQTSLEALLLKATNSKNQNIDTAAVEAFAALINKEKDGAHIGVKVIAATLPTGSEKEVLQTLNILDSCMSKCGTHFQNEVGKFRFLNEMIKLVSPKYLGSETPLSVKQKVLQLLYVWTLDYPKETKIKEAFDMLRKQGVIREIPNPNVPSYEPLTMPKKKPTGFDSSVFHDEGKSKILQKLLQSKDPEDIQAANWLIKSMVKEDDKRAELKKISELQSVQYHVKLLNEMLDNYEPTKSTAGELDLIKELHDNCERLRPTINKLALETQDSDGMLGAVLETNDEISSVFHKYNVLILQSQAASSKAPNGMQSSLLHFECDDSSTIQNACKAEPKSSVDVLCDILTATTIPDNSGEVLKPVSVLNCDKISVCDDDKEMRQNKFKALEDLDVLDISDEKMLVVDKASNVGSPSIPNMNNEKKTIQDSKRHDIKLSDVFVKLEDIRPSNIPPITLMEEKNKISVTLHISKDKPKDFVNVYVLTAVSKSELPLSNYLFQAVLPKECKLKLQPPSSTNLPAYNPFLPPSAITQIMIIANPDSTKLTLKFVISYVMDDETITEMGEVDELPTLQE